MRAVDIVRLARVAGIRIRVEDDQLVLEAAAPPASDLVALLAKNKPAVMTYLKHKVSGWSAEEWWAYFIKVAEVAELDGGLAPREARARAYACCAAEWLVRNPAASETDKCVTCGRNDEVGPLLPFGDVNTGIAWSHSSCWPAWYSSRKTDAASALAALGIMTPL